MDIAKILDYKPPTSLIVDENVSEVEELEHNEIDRFPLANVYQVKKILLSSSRLIFKLAKSSLNPVIQ
jgi:hypothetical protein